MAGASDSIFREKITSYLQNLMGELATKYGEESPEFRAISLQYLKNPAEDNVSASERGRHYEAEVHLTHQGKALRGVERLYRRTILIEPSTVCAAHCRWCLRGQYPVFSLREEEIANFAKYCGSAEVLNDLREILITGGDPFMVPQRLALIISLVKEHAPNIQIIRIGTRVPVQEPVRVNGELLDVLRSSAPIKIEIGTHINHPIELSKEARNAYRMLSSEVSRIYDQTVLLKGVNDDADVLNKLYDEIRYLGIEAHYLFHCIPMRGMFHHRTSIQKGLDLMSKITSAGEFSGRAKPMYTVMTDLGKITLYEGSILERNANGEVLLRSSYRIEDFKQRNPSWQLPSSASVDKDGCLLVWYPDGSDS
jgi:lysine 2,3-aminomutase